MISSSAPAGAHPACHATRAAGILRAPSVRPIVSKAITALAVGVAIFLGALSWHTYLSTPWTRDGTVRAYVVSLAPEVAGRIVTLRVTDNQFVSKGDVLMTIEPVDYAIAVDQAQAALDQASANLVNAQREARRRAGLPDVAASVEEKQSFATTAAVAEAETRRIQAALAKARIDLERTTIRSPVNGYVSNLNTQVGDYASVGKTIVSIVDADSYWVDGYFEESTLDGIRPGAPARVKLMGTTSTIEGHVDSIAGGITVQNAQPGPSGLATVNPIYTWVRLAQRIPVRIRIDRVPEGTRLVAGRTATVEIVGS